MWAEHGGEWYYRSSMPVRTLTRNRRRSGDEGMRTILVALGAGLGVALAKAGAAVFTASSALAAEASHSLADSANDLFLFVAQRRSSRPPSARHPLGHGREAYFWALIAACGAFVAGAAFSLRDGINELMHPTATSSFALAYAGRVWIVARVDIDDHLRGDQVESLVRGIESCMRNESDNIHRIDIVPIGGERDGELG